MSFGATAVDANGVIQRWPAVSLLTGICANALGYRRTESDRLNRLQSRLRWAVRIDREGEVLTDFQTAQLAKGDRGWTTWGVPEGRDGGAQTYESPHLRYRDYAADASVLVALRLEPPDEDPSLEQLRAALQRPARALFIGRKSCPPAVPFLAGDCLGENAVEALNPPPGPAGPRTVFFTEGEAAIPCVARHRVSDRRQFDVDVHAGEQVICEALLPSRRDR